MIDSAPEVVLHPVDLHKDFVEMPTPVLKIAHRLDPVPADLCCEDRPEPVPSEPPCLVRDVDSALMQQILDVPQ